MTSVVLKTCLLCCLQKLVFSGSQLLLKVGKHVFSGSQNLCFMFSGTISSLSVNMFVRGLLHPRITLSSTTLHLSSQIMFKGSLLSTRNMVLIFACVAMSFGSSSSFECVISGEPMSLMWSQYLTLFILELDFFVFLRLSYKLTHLYYNWPGTVRVPAPCQVWL